MDVNDVSNEHWLHRMMDRWQQNADQVQQRRGQLVRDHPPANQVVSKYMVNMLAAKLQQNMTYNTATSQLPPPYPPCERPMGELTPVPITDMRLETYHHSQMALVRVLTPPKRMTAVMAIVEDEQGTALLLQSYHQPANVPAEEIMQLNDVFLLKEPFLKIATDGSYSLRVDHLS